MCATLAKTQGRSAVGNLALSKSRNVALCGDNYGISMLLPQEPHSQKLS